MDLICITGLEVRCILGVRPHERRRRQLVRVDLGLGLDLSRAGHSGRIAHTVDYSQIAEEVTALLRFRDYRLIEVATEEVAAMLLGVHPLLGQVNVRIAKPAALSGLAADAAVQVVRERAVFAERLQTQYGETETLLTNREASLCLHHVDPGCSFAGAAREGWRRVEWLVSGELQFNGQRLFPMRPKVLASLSNGAYVNLSAERAALFSCVQHSSTRE